MTEEWAEELKQMPFASKQKGRMCALLKAKSKVGGISRERKQYEVLDISKKFRTSDGRTIEIKQGT